MLQVLGDIAMVVFNNVIAPAISFLVQLFSTLWSIVQPILTTLSLLFEAISAVIKRLWDNVLTQFIDFILTGVKNGFDNFAGALNIVQGWFKTLSGWISTAYGHVKDFIGIIGNVKVPDWLIKGVSSTFSFVGNLFGGGKGDKQDGSYYHCLSAVHYNGYVASMQKGEKILSAQEAKACGEGRSCNNGGVVITGNSFTVREEADIEKIAYSLARLIERQAMQVG